MNRPGGIKCFLLVMVVCLSVFLSFQAGEGNASPTDLLTDQELDNLLAPIALYPDPLLAQMLPASTYPAEIADAEAWINSGGGMSRIDGQNWDESVKTIAHYPNILKMMAEYLDWTADLGDTFLTQPEDVTRSIQRLRWQARNAGNLESTSQQTVIIDGDYIEIIPAQPQYVYVPQYDPSVVYIQRWTPGGSPFITFGLGLVIGSWLSMDFDWSNHHVIYHGWNRSGWVNRAKPYVPVTNVYINRSRPYINQTWRHDASHGDPGRYRASRPSGGTSVVRQTRMPEVRGRATISPRPTAGIFGPKGDIHTISNRGKESRGIVPTRTTAPAQDVTKRPALPAPGISKGPSQASPARESLQPPRTPSATIGGKESRGIVPTRPMVPTQVVTKRPALPAPGISKGPSQASPARENLQPPRTPSATIGGKEGRGIVTARPTAPTQDVTKRPTIPAPGISKGPSQASPARESLQPPRTPSAAFGGYRGANEAKAQSLRGQASRQSGAQVNPSAAPVKKGNVPAEKNATGGKQRR